MIRPAVVVTGVSTGIGLASAKALIEAGFHVFGSVRKQHDAERLQADLGTESFTPLLFDVTDESAIARCVEQVRRALKGRRLAGLVNNAGIANHACLAHQLLREFRKVIEVNLIGTLAVTRAFLPLLGAGEGGGSLQGPPGRIVMLSSTSGKWAAPFVGAYTASKHGLEGMSDALRRELMLFGIDVIVVGPGYVATPIWDRGEIVDTVAQYRDTEYATSLAAFDRKIVADVQTGLFPKEVARTILHALTAKAPRTRYALVAQPLFNWILPMWLPARWVDALLAKAFLVKTN